MAFDDKFYVPILKAKAGELKALKEAAPDVRAGFSPLLEIMDVAPKYVEGEDDPVPSKSDEAHIKTVADNIAKAVGSEQRFFADGVYCEQMDALADGREPMAALMDYFREAKLKVVPVTGLDRVKEYNDAVKSAIESDGRGLCLRLQESDLESDDLEKQVESALKHFGLPPKRVDLLVDYGPAITPRSAIVPLINTLPFLTDWRTFTVSACSFPTNMAGFAQYSVAEIPREEWLNWTYLRSRSEKAKRMPTFSDYTINHPEVSEIDPREMRMSCNIRYTWTTTYVVAKGEVVPRRSDKDTRAPSKEQYPRLAQMIMEHKAWQGGDFSWGDDYIQKCARKECVGGGREWRAVGTSHHVAFVVKQLASLP
jgi:hypothetical protein